MQGDMKIIFYYYANLKNIIVLYFTIVNTSHIFPRRSF